MVGFIARVLPFAVILVLWFYLNREIDAQEKRIEEIKQRPILGKLFFLYGWTFKIGRFGKTIRYLVTGTVLFFVARWFFLITSTPR